MSPASVMHWITNSARPVLMTTPFESIPYASAALSSYFKMIVRSGYSTVSNTLDKAVSCLTSLRRRNISLKVVSWKVCEWPFNTLLRATELLIWRWSWKDVSDNWPTAANNPPSAPLMGQDEILWHIYCYRRGRTWRCSSSILILFSYLF